MMPKPAVPLEDCQREYPLAESLAPSLHKDPGIQGHHHSHPSVRCRDLGSLWEVDQATGVVLLKLLALHPRHQMARPHVEQISPQESQPAQHRIHLASGAAALGWPSHKDGWKMYTCKKQSSSARCKKTGRIMVLQESVTKTR